MHNEMTQKYIRRTLRIIIDWSNRALDRYDGTNAEAINEDVLSILYNVSALLTELNCHIGR